MRQGLPRIAREVARIANNAVETPLDSVGIVRNAVGIP